MPLFYQHNINDHSRLGIWQIKEPESFFLKTIPLKKDVSHPHKRLQHLAGRYLLPFLFDDFPLSEILIADTRKPFLENEKFHFSISHCGDYGAAIVSSANRVGIDIELMTPKIEKISHKFLSVADRNFVDDQRTHHDLEKLLTILWSSKEAIFKWYGLGEVDFINHMQLRKTVNATNENEWELPFVFKKAQPIDLSLHIKTFDKLVLAWVLT